MVIYRENGVLKVTTKENYNRPVANARQIHTLADFTTPEEVIEYFCKYCGSKKEDFTIIQQKRKLAVVGQKIGTPATTSF